MQASYLKIAYIALCFCVLLIIAIYYIGLRDKKFKIIMPKINNSEKLWLSIYKFLTSNSITREIASNIRGRLIIINDYSESDLRINVSRIFILSNIPALIVILILFIFIKEWYLMLLLSLAIFSVPSVFIDYYLDSVREKLLNQMIDFNDILRKKYLGSNMVDEAYYNAVSSMDSIKYKDIITQANRIYDILLSSNAENELNEYYLKAPNRYLKLLAGISYITREYGDTKVEGNSHFAKSLSQISMELREELLFKQKLNLALKSLSWLAILPLFAIGPIKKWASSNFYPMDRFYNSPQGVICEVFVLFSVFIAFMMLRSVQRFNNESDEKERGIEFINFCYTRFRGFVQLIIPDKSSKKYRKTLSSLKRTMYNGKIEWFYTNKLLYCVLAFLLATLMNIGFIITSTNAVLNSPSLDTGFLVGELKGNMLLEANKNSAMDKEVIAKLDEQLNTRGISIFEPKLADKTKIRQILISDYNIKPEALNNHIKRIATKCDRLESFRFNYKNVLIIYLFSVMGFLTPNLLLSFKWILIKNDIALEVVRFQMIISALMRIKNMSVDIILEWLERFSYVYKKPLQRAIMDYDSGALLALYRLKDSSDYDEFQKLVDHLISSVEELTIVESFSELESEKQYYYDKRHNFNEVIIEKKINLGKAIGFLPIYSLLVIYFVVPLVYVSLTELNTYFNMLK